jgi:hypothetical protein
MRLRFTKQLLEGRAAEARIARVRAAAVTLKVLSSRYCSARRRLAEP